jgi:hypothetical protein
VSARVLRPSRRRNAVRIAVGLALGAVGTAMLATGYWGGLVLLAIGLWPLSLAILVAFRARAYELHLDEDGFRVHDAFGRLTHDVSWLELVDMRVVGANAYSFLVLAWVCSPRKPKHGRWRWKRGTKDDDGCMPDTYRMRADDLARLMWSYRNARVQAAPASSLTLEPF